MTAELLDHGQERVGRRGLLVTAAVVLVVAVLALLAADRWLRGREFDALLSRAAAGQESVAYADRRIASTVSYTSPILGAANTTPEVRRSLAQLVAQSAAGQLPDLRQDRDATAATRIPFWHAPQRAARTASVAYLDTRLAYLQEVADNIGALYVRHPELLAAITTERAALLAAAPDAAGRARVTALLPD